MESESSINVGNEILLEKSDKTYYSSYYSEIRNRVIALIIITAICFLIIYRTSNDNIRASQLSKLGYNEISTPFTSSYNSYTRVAFIGNSMMYFNDCPRFLSQLSKGEIIQDSCLRGGSSLISIYAKGNGMLEKFRSQNAMKDDGTYDIGASSVSELLNQNSWDFVIMNDYSQGPARVRTRNKTINFLKSTYSPFFESTNATPILLMTAAYRDQVKNSSDLGSVKNFTELLYEGYQDYALALDESLGRKVTRVAPVGKAYYTVYTENQTLWKNLYYTDGMHPSVHGTFLEGCVLYWSIFGKDPPAINDIKSLWNKARRFYPPENQDEIDFPSKEEAQYLMSTAKKTYFMYGL